MRISVGEGRHQVWAEICAVGDDLILLVGGGDKPHIGSVCIAVPYDKGAGKIRATPSCVYTMPGPKDDVVVRKFAEELAKHFNTPVLCVGGIHLEDATEEEIKLMVENADKLLLATVKAIEAGEHK